jgi:hypothetical protein
VVEAQAEYTLKAHKELPRALLEPVVNLHSLSVVTPGPVTVVVVESVGLELRAVPEELHPGQTEIDLMVAKVVQDLVLVMRYPSVASVIPLWT